MEIKLRIGDINKTGADAILFGVFDDVKKLSDELTAADKALDGEITKLIKQGEIKGKAGEISIIHTMGKVPAGKAVVIGLGKSEDLTADKIRIAIADACRALRKKGVKHIETVLIGAGVNNISPGTAAQAITEGAILGLYTFNRHITKKQEQGEIGELVINDRNLKNKAAVQQGINTGKILAEAANLARDMVNEPSNFMTPTIMAAEARKVAEKHGLDIKVLERKQMKALGMGGLLGVAQGSEEPPKFIVLKYLGKNTKTIDIALVGKGITFDSGGISIKPSDHMGDMKSDMSGAASVIAAIGAIAQLKPKVNVMAIVPATENLPSGTAFKPADILTAMNGKTIEIITTDAEGRLILADEIGRASCRERVSSPV